MLKKLIIAIVIIAFVPVSGAFAEDQQKGTKAKKKLEDISKGWKLKTSWETLKSRISCPPIATRLHRRKSNWFVEEAGKLLVNPASARVG